jgi:hypothetical protein
MRKSSKLIPDGADKTVRDIRRARRREAFSEYIRVATHRRGESRHANLGLGRDLGAGCCWKDAWRIFHCGATSP